MQVFTIDTPYGPHYKIKTPNADLNQYCKLDSHVFYSYNYGRPNPTYNINTLYSDKVVSIHFEANGITVTGYSYTGKRDGSAYIHYQHKVVTEYLPYVSPGYAQDGLEHTQDNDCAGYVDRLFKVLTSRTTAEIKLYRRKGMSINKNGLKFDVVVNDKYEHVEEITISSNKQQVRLANLQKPFQLLEMKEYVEQLVDSIIARIGDDLNKVITLEVI